MLASRRVFQCAFVVALTLAPAAHAFDVDTHYVWTFYLAQHVGYTPRQAYQISSAAFAIDHDKDTGPMEAGALDAIVGPEPFGWARNPRIASIWRRFHCFTDRFRSIPGLDDTVNTSHSLYARLFGRRWSPSFDYGNLKEVAGWAGEVGGPIDMGRQDNANALWVLARQERNPGPLIHFTQDFFSHFEFTDLRGHAAAGHGPDFLSFNPNRSRAMTRATLDVLERFMRYVLRREPQRVDHRRITQVLDALVRANPAPNESPRLYDRAVNFNPYANRPPGAPSKYRAIDVVDNAMKEDRRRGLLPRMPREIWTEIGPPENWIQYDYDPDGRVRANNYPIENLRVTVGRPSATLRAVPGSPNRAQQVTLRVSYTVEGLTDLRPYLTPLPIYIEAHVSDFSTPTVLRGDRFNGTFWVERKIQRSAAALDRGLGWKVTVWPYGFDPQVVELRIPAPRRGSPIRPDSRDREEDRRTQRGVSKRTTGSYLGNCRWVNIGRLPGSGEPDWRCRCDRVHPDGRVTGPFEPLDGGDRNEECSPDQFD